MTDKSKPVEGRVAAILNARELVINVGSEEGVKLEMKFAVLAESPTVICDPMTGEELGRIDREKVRVEAIDVQPKITVCRTFRLTKINAGLLATAALMNMNSLMTTPNELPETLRLRDANVLPPLPEEESYVKVKDRVIQVD